MKIVLTPKTGKSQNDGQLVELETYDKRPIPQSLVEYLAQKFPLAIGKVVFHLPANQTSQVQHRTAILGTGVA